MKPCPITFCRICTVIAVLAVLPGCVVVPNLKRIQGAEEVARITLGESDRAEVIELLGPSNVASGPDLLVYNWEKSRFFYAVGAMYAADAGSGGHRGFRAIVELDPDGRAIRVLSEDSRDTPNLPVEEWERIRGCGRIQRPIAVTVSSDGAQTAALLARELCVVPTDNPEGVKRIPLDRTLRPRYPFGTSLQFAPNGQQLAVVLPGSSPALLDGATGAVVRRFGEQPAKKSKWTLLPRPVAFSPDGQQLAASAESGKVNVWETESAEELLHHTPSGAVGTITFSHDGGFIALGLVGGGLEILETETATPVLMRPGIADSSDVASTAFSPDGAHLAVATPVHLELWDLQTLKESGWTAGRRGVFLLPFYRHTPASNAYKRPVIGFSPDGSTLAVFVHETVTVIDVAPPAMRQTYRFTFPFITAAFDPGWKRLALLTVDGLRVWDIQDREHQGDNPHSRRTEFVVPTAAQAP